MQFWKEILIYSSIDFLSKIALFKHSMKWSGTSPCEGISDLQVSKNISFANVRWPLAQPITDGSWKKQFLGITKMELPLPDFEFVVNSLLIKLRNFARHMCMSVNIVLVDVIQDYADVPVTF